MHLKMTSIESYNRNDDDFNGNIFRPIIGYSKTIKCGNNAFEIDKFE